MPSPLSFHADPQKLGYILYQGTKCESIGLFYRSCHDEVRLTVVDVCSLILTHDHLGASRMIDILHPGSVRRHTQEDARTD